MLDKPVIRLYESWGLGVIVEHPSGVLYSNQVGGHSVLQPVVEGVFVPLFDEIKGEDQERQLQDFFTGEKWMGICDRDIDGETADFIDTVLSQSIITDDIRVDRSKLAKSCEAWVYVAIGEHIDPDLKESLRYQLSSLIGFHGKSAILTWANSD
jgi:uncharacterized protein DUF6210